MISNKISRIYHSNSSYREIAPLRAHLEEPKTPLLINAGVLIIFIVKGAKTLYDGSRT
jgi:hypothetical protein